MYPTDRRYTKDHEWILVEGDTGSIGITDFAQNELGDIVYVELPETGAEVKQGDTLGSIESVKAVSELYAAVSGTIVEVNKALTDNPEVINKDAHGAGWYCKLKLSEASEVADLMEADAYRELVGQE